MPTSDRSVPEAAFTHFVFVDFENRPTVDLSAIGGQPVHVTLLIGKKQEKFGFELVKQIKEFAAQVELVQVGASGRNALDITLAYYLGRAIECASKAKFAIVSGDNDYDAMIAHLSNHEVKVAITRYDNFSALPFLHHRKPALPPKSVVTTKPAPTKPVAIKKPPEDRCAKVIARLKNPLNPNRPATEKALLAHLKASLGKQASDTKVDEVFHKLREDTVVLIDANGKVSYPQAS
jgi:hypothetical protein